MIEWLYMVTGECPAAACRGIHFGGKQMDMFMDKLAQKLNAQEIIKANTSAETEELNSLRSQITEYNDCLERLKQLTEDAAEKLQGSQSNGEEIDRLVEESIEKIKSLQQDSAALEQLQKSLSERLDETDRKQGERLSSVNRILDEKLDGMDRTLDERLEGMDSLLGARFERMDRNLGDKLEQLVQQRDESSEDQLIDQLAERFNATDDNVHRECVKVYRNVQAVVVEEGGKQSEALNEAKGKVDSMGGKLKMIMGISVAALIFSIVSAAMQILTYLNIL